MQLESQPHAHKAGRFGPFGGAYVPQILVRPLRDLEDAFAACAVDVGFQREFHQLLKDFAGRPTAFYACRNIETAEGALLFLKREDLLHGGAHKTTQALGQALLAKRMGKTRLIAETGAGQHGVATAMVGALLGLEVVVYMGAVDVARQRPNVERMKLFGATVVEVTTGSQTLKDAINDALRDWAATFETSHYLLGTAAGPHPFPTMVRTFARIIGDEMREQCLADVGCLPDTVVACVGGGSNAIGAFAAFLDDDVQLVGVEPAGRGLHTREHGATLQRGRHGIAHGAETLVLCDDDGQLHDTHSIAAGLDYPAVGPEHAFLQATGRATYVGCTDDDALHALRTLAAREGILCALESAHAVAEGMRRVQQKGAGVVVVNLSGRGDKDLATLMQPAAEGGAQ